MKMPKILLIQPEYDVELSRPILGRIELLLKYPTVCKFFTATITTELCGHELKLRKIWCIGLPKIRIVDHIEESEIEIRGYDEE